MIFKTISNKVKIMFQEMVYQEKYWVIKNLTKITLIIPNLKLLKILTHFIKIKIYI